ncbi:MAG: FkbM family methyltransferase, partial [Nitrososphaera sp.]
MIAEIFVNKEYTWGDFDIKHNDVVVDIGAHRGVFVAYAAQRTRNKIVAFEPDDENFSQLQALIVENKWSHVDVINTAVTGGPSHQVELFSGHSTSRHTFLGKDVVTGSPLSRSKLVKAITLDEVLDSLSSVDLLKMDCEGAEFSIISAADSAVIRKAK